MHEPGAPDSAAVWGQDPASVDTWNLPTGPAGRGGLEYQPLLEAFRVLQDRFAGAAIPAQAAAELTARLAALSDDLARYQVPEPERYDGQRPDLPGRGSALIPPYIVDEVLGKSVRGRVTFRRFHLGGNAAAHGGTLPLLFDDVLGKVANYQQVTLARTVDLQIRYRRITPIGAELRLDARLESVEGRKRSATGTLTDAAGLLLVEARGLFVELLPGQQ
jgi:acyl-coenzyme A thioesterase PaaI-like protein